MAELISLSEEEERWIQRDFTAISLKKKDFLFRPGDRCEHMRFIAMGCMRLYSLDANGKEHILQFGLETWWMNDLYAYLSGRPATYFMQAITDSVVLQIHRDRLNQLFDRSHQIDRFFRLKIQSGYLALQERSMHYITEAAEKRFVEFIHRYRGIEQQIPQYMIASYLGISAEHLSVIRKNTVRKLS